MPTPDEVRTHASIHALAEQARRQTKIADRAQKVAEWASLNEVFRLMEPAGPQLERMRFLASELWPSL